MFYSTARSTIGSFGSNNGCFRANLNRDSKSKICCSAQFFVSHICCFQKHFFVALKCESRVYCCTYSVRANLNRDTNNLLLYFLKKMNLKEIHFTNISVRMAKQLAVFFKSLQTCASDSAKIFAMCTSKLFNVSDHYHY